MLADLHDEMIAYLGTKLPGVTVAAYTPDLKTQRTLAVPACLVELATIEPFSEFGNRRDRSRVYLNWEIRLLVDSNVAAGWVVLKEFAAVAWWALRDWSAQTSAAGPVNLRRAGEDVFKPNLDGFLVWLIECEQEVYLDFTPEQVLPMVAKITVEDNYGNTIEAD